MKSLYLLVIALFISSCVFQAEAFEDDFADDDHLALLELSLHMNPDSDYSSSSSPSSPSSTSSPSSDFPSSSPSSYDSGQYGSSNSGSSRSSRSNSGSFDGNSGNSGFSNSRHSANSGKSATPATASKKSSFKPVDPEKFAPPPLEQMPIPEVEPMNPLAQTSVEKELAKAQQLYTTLLGQITREQDWARSVNEIIQNYQFKYSRVLKDVKTRKDKISRVRQLISLLKKAQLHKMLEGQLMKATEVLGSFSDSSKYGGVVEKVSELRNTLNKLAPETVGGAVNSVDEKLVPIVTDVALPDSNDAVKSLLSSSDKQ